MTKINTNFSSLVASQNAARAFEDIKKSLTRLTTGQRINNSAEDAAGLTVANKLLKQITSIDKASFNSSNAISLLQTADSGLSEINNIIHRMNELSIQMSNGIFKDIDYDNATFEFEELRREVFRIVYNTKYNNIKLLDGTYANNLLTGDSLQEELNLTIDGLKLEKTITGRIIAEGNSEYQVKDVTFAQGSSLLDFPDKSLAVGNTEEFQSPIGTAVVTKPSDYIGGGFDNGDFDNVTITTNGVVDSFDGWEAHRAQVMLSPNPDILSSITSLSANETNGEITANENVLESIKTFSGLKSSIGGEFRLTTLGDGEKFTFTDNANGTFDLVTGSQQIDRISNITAYLVNAANGDSFSIDVLGTGTISTGAITGAASAGDYSIADLARDLNNANALSLTPASINFRAIGNDLEIVSNAKGANLFSASNFSYTDASLALTSIIGIQTNTRLGFSTNDFTSAVRQVDRVSSLSASLLNAIDGDEFSIDIGGFGTIKTNPLSGIINPGDYTINNLANDLNLANSGLISPADILFSSDGSNLIITSANFNSFTASNFQFHQNSLALINSVGNLTTVTSGSAPNDQDRNGVYEALIEFEDLNGTIFSENISLTINSNGASPLPVSSIATGTSQSDIQYAVIDGFLTPEDSTPTPSNPRNPTQISSGDGNAAPNANLNFQISNGMARLYSNMTIPRGDVFHGPYLISDNSVSLNQGDDVTFDFRALGGGDAYDVFAYLLETTTGQTIELLNQTGVGNSDTGIINVSNRVNATGDYKFIFISGTFDETFGTAAGASLYIDNVNVVRNSVPSAVRAGIVNAEVSLTVQEATNVQISSSLLEKLNGFAISDNKAGTFNISTSGSDYNKFTIDPLTGDISSVVPIIFYANMDDLQFDVTYTSADLLTTFTETVKLQVTETFDAEGSFILQESVIGSIAGKDLTLAQTIAENDLFNGNFSLNSSNGDHNYFSIATDGTITSKSRLDYDTKNEFIFNAIYTTSGLINVTERITINLIDTLSSTTSLSVEEAQTVKLDNNALSELIIHARKDQFKGGFKMGMASDNQYFDVNQSGEVISKNSIRLSSKDQYNIDVIYTDSLGAEFVDHITINITPTTIRKSITNLEISEGSLLELEPGRLPNIHKYAKSDEFRGRFELLSATENPDDYTLFEISNMGRIKGDFLFDFESGKRQYNLIVRYNKLGSSEYYDEVLNIFLNDDRRDNNILSFEEVNITDEGNANAAQTVLSEVFNRINIARSSLGSMETRLQHNINHLEFKKLSSKLSYGLIMDTDFAEETVLLSKKQILYDSSTAMLAHANSKIGMLLKLLEKPTK